MKKINVVCLNQSDLVGGAGISGYRLHQGFHEHDFIESRMLVGLKRGTDISIEGLAPVRLKDRLLREVSNIAAYYAGFTYLNITSSFFVKQHEFAKSADIFNLHNLHTGYFNYAALPGLVDSRPVVYTLHDMWAMTGHCAYSFSCDKWKNQCGSCPSLSSYPAVYNDTTHFIWKHKKKVFSRLNMTVVTPSKWMHDIAASSLLSEHEILHIPNGLDLNLYYPRDGSLLRPLLGIPKDNFVIIMAAENLKDKRKGVASIFEAISILHESIKEQITLLLIGNTHGFEQLDLGVHEVRMGFVYEENLKASLFSLADLFVFPSIADNLPIVIQESLACGTPVISFDVGGIPEMVINDVTGWLLEEVSCELLSEAITKVVSNREGVSALSDSCRKFACEYYAIEDQVSNYANLYSRLVEKNR